MLKKWSLARYVKQSREVPQIDEMTTESILCQQQYIRRGGCDSFSGKNAAGYSLNNGHMRIYRITFELSKSPAANYTVKDIPYRLHGPPNPV